MTLEFPDLQPERTVSRGRIIGERDG